VPSSRAHSSAQQSRTSSIIGADESSTNELEENPVEEGVFDQDEDAVLLDAARDVKRDRLKTKKSVVGRMDSSVVRKTSQVS
jgi:hypothetical protein